MTHIYDILAPVLGICTALALALLIVLLLLGPTRKFWVVLVYASYELLATVGLTLADLYLHGTAQVDQPSDASRLYARLYWTNDVIDDLLRFVLLTVLIYMVVGSSKPLLGRVLTGLVLAMIVLPFLLYQPIFPPTPSLTLFPRWYPTREWFNSTSQLLYFGAAIMNVILWGALIQSKKRDPQILAMSLGLGILLTSFAIGYGLRHFIPQGGFTAAFNLFLNLAQLGAWLICCRAFWPARRHKMPGAAVLTQ